MTPAKTKEDPYNWLRDESRKDEVVLSHIKAENDYCQQEMAPLVPLQEELYAEMLSHLKETDEDVRERDRGSGSFCNNSDGDNYNHDNNSSEGDCDIDNDSESDSHNS